MLTDRHIVDIIVNGKKVDIYSQNKLNLRMNNVIFDPTAIQTKTGEYSFSFELPATPNNNRIFSYANNSAKLGKFSTKYDCEVIADGLEMFKGTLRLSETRAGNYKCNLVNIKIYNVDEIFSDMVMSDIVWNVDFSGTDTINTVNNDLSTTYYFPLVCYGAFQKDPKAVYNNEISEYTDLLTIDYYNKWYWESLHPSFSVLEVIRRLFDSKGYKVSGDIFNDPAMKRLYLSEYIDSDQDPHYNLNRDSIGKLHVAGRYSNGGMLDAGTVTNSNAGNSSRVWPKSITGSFNDLTFPKEQVYQDTYQWDRVCWFDVFGTPSGSSTHTFTTPPDNKYIYRQNSPNNSSGFIYIPSDGLYTIELAVDNVTIEDEVTSDIWWKKKELQLGQTPTIVEVEKPLERNLEQMPFEIHLVRNSNETELIGTRDAKTYLMYPHEMDYTKYSTIQRNTGNTSTNSTQTTNTTQPSGRTASNSRGSGPQQGRTSAQAQTAASSGTSSGTYRSRTYNAPDELYYARYKQMIAYDPFANPNFICGFSSLNMSPAVIKNGTSWNKSVGDFNQSHFRCNGYVRRYRNGGEEQTQYNETTLQCPLTDYFSAKDSLSCKGRVTCVVELKKNDRISLELVTRYYYGVRRRISVIGPNGRQSIRETEADGTYNVRFDYDLTITPYTDKKDQYINVKDLPYLPSDEVKKNGWGTQLRLGKFMNSKEKASDFVNNFIKTFNLEYIQDGKNIIINKAKKDFSTMAYVDLDDRVNTSDITFKRIEYPNSMQVKWSIDEEEAGAYRSIDTVEHQGADNWKDYIDRGSEKVYMDTTNESADTSLDSKFSYTWYQDFNYVDFDRNTFIENGHVSTFRLPLISKDEYFIVQNDDAMQHDGLSLKQRLWFRDKPKADTLMMWNGDEAVVTIPTDTYGETTLNLKRQTGSVLDRYFNIVPMVDSNFAEVEVYLTPFEYMQLKKGAVAKIDNDLYIVSEITAFDPTGNNRTTLKLIKIVN